MKLSTLKLFLKDPTELVLLSLVIFFSADMLDLRVIWRTE